MSVYIYIHMKLYIRTRTYIHEQHIYIHTYTRIYTRIHTHIHTRTHTHTKRILVGHLVHIIRPSRRIRSVISRGGSVSPLRGLNIALYSLGLALILPAAICFSTGASKSGWLREKSALGSGGGSFTCRFPAAATRSRGASKKAGSTSDWAAAAPEPAILPDSIILSTGASKSGWFLEKSELGSGGGWFTLRWPAAASLSSGASK
mmetsp:Transcript_35520/g.52154  ORF Transcript_35520/g.52154 Transcript_35520/m.52154 type:complete len:204 (-) Transcript_35520:222-833(-)